LIETLVAVVILGIGVLSIVALQLVSKRANQDAHSQSLASQMAYDLYERMRINNTAVALGEYLSRSGAGIGRNQQSAVTCTEDSPCNRAAIADYDVYTFEQQLDGATETIVEGNATTQAGGLLSPTACIAGPNGGVSGIYTITVAWRSQVPLPPDGAIGCGLGLGLYGSATDECATVGQADCLRRIVQIQGYIN
jgi:type IV pilus assembly protein PilV